MFFNIMLFCLRYSKTLAHLLSCKFCTIINNSFFYRTLPMAAYGAIKLVTANGSRNCLPPPFPHDTISLHNFVMSSLL